MVMTFRARPWLYRNECAIACATGNPDTSGQIRTIAIIVTIVIIRTYEILLDLSGLRAMIECRQKLTSEKIMAAHKTAITRKKLSKPARYLKDNELLRGRVLDYGCGRGGDTERIGCEGYDPHFRPEQPVGKFDTIMCNFVLNVIEPPKAIERVIRDIQGRLTKYGTAFIAVRADRKALVGRTSIGTWQGLVVLDLPVVHRDSGVIIYALTPGCPGFTVRVDTFPKKK
jgi:hypothetical protein